MTAPTKTRPPLRWKTEQRGWMPEQRILLHGIDWKAYEAITAAFGERSDIRTAYLDGMLEIMTPSPEHEVTKILLGRLLEAYAEEFDLPLNGMGSTTFRKKAKERGLEPDECYCLGRLAEAEGDHPDIAIEVVVTTGWLNKLQVYQGLRVPEVWFWKKGKFYLFHLTTKGYVQVERSKFLPGLDLDLLSRHLDITSDQTRAVKAFRQALRAQDA